MENTVVKQIDLHTLEQKGLSLQGVIKGECDALWNLDYRLASSSLVNDQYFILVFQRKA